MTATAEQEDEYNACFDQPRAASDSDSQQWDNSTLVTRYTATTAVTATATATADTASISSFAPHVAAQLTLALLLSSIILVTLAGNVLVVVAIYRFRKLKKQVCYMFTSSLAVADIMVASLVMSFSMLYILTGRWLVGWAVCKVWISFDVMCCTASILHLCLISVDRYIAITEPLRYRILMTRRLATAMITTSWLLAAFISFVPIQLDWYSNSNTNSNSHSQILTSIEPFNASDGWLMAAYGYDEPSDRCSLDVNRTYAVISSFTSFYVPILVMLFVYFRIYHIAADQSREITKLQVLLPQPRYSVCGTEATLYKKHSRSKTSDSKAIRTLGLIVGSFCVCWLPFILMYIIAPFCTTCSLSEAWINFITWIGYANSAFNPFLYFFFNREVRLAFRTLLCGEKLLA